MDLTVVKVGGRLGREGRLRPLARRLCELARRHDLLVVPGGGSFADAVRDLDAREGLDDSTAHWMAVAAMDVYALALAGLIDGSRLVTTRAQALRARRGEVRVLAPAAWMRAADPLPHSWHVTSDSIAAWVAGACGAARLVLLKDTAGAAVPLPSGEPAGCRELNVDDVRGWPAVDLHLAQLLPGLGARLHVVDGGVEGQLEDLLEPGLGAGLSQPGGAP